MTRVLTLLGLLGLAACQAGNGVGTAANGFYMGGASGVTARGLVAF